MLKPDHGLSVTSSKSHLSPSGRPKPLGSLPQVLGQHHDGAKELVGFDGVRLSPGGEPFGERATSGNDRFEPLVSLRHHVPFDGTGTYPVTGLDLVRVRDLLAREASRCREKAYDLGTEPPPPAL